MSVAELSPLCGPPSRLRGKAGAKRPAITYGGGCWGEYQTKNAYANRVFLICRKSARTIQAFAAIVENFCLRVIEMANPYVICAEIDAEENVAAGLFAGDWFNCGINENSQRYPSADAALVAAKGAYKGPDVAGIGCRVWAKQAA